MNEKLIILIIALMVGGMAFILLHLYTTLSSAVPEDDRQYMDKLPLALRMLWPVVRLLEFHLTSHISLEKLEKTNTQLNTSGVAHMMNAEQFYAVRVLSVIVFSALVHFVLSMLQMTSPMMIVVGVAVGYLYPKIWLNDSRKRRYKLVQKDIPMFMDFITMAVEAGLNLTGALNQVVQKGPAGPLRQEFVMVVRDLRSGLPRADALRRFEERLLMPEVSSFVGTVIQAEKMGASLGPALRAQADQRRNERFQRAEKLAMEAPVKLIGPLMMFIFPVTFIVIGFPIVIKFLKSGLF
jgi:tight adherence protein C